MAERPPSFHCILEDTQKYIGWLPEEVQSLKRVEIEREVLELKNLLEEEEKKHSELQKKIEELDMKSSSSRDARKMYGDIRPGDTTHQDVMMAYKNFHNNAPRNLLKELPAEADKFKIWEVISYIVQESFKENKDDIIRKINEKLHEVLLEDVAKPLDEETTDLIRAFSMFTTESVRLESVKQLLLKEDHCDHHAIERATEIIYKKLNPKHFDSFFQEDCVSESGVIVHGTSKYHESVDSQYHQKDEKEKRKHFWRSKSNSEIETYASAGRNNTKKSSSNKKKFEPKIDTEKVYQKLKEKMTEAIEILELLEKKESIKRKLIRIENEIKTMKKRADDETASIPMYTLESKDRDALENKIILKLIEAFIHDLKIILICTSNEYIDGGSDTREKYKIYGLVLSACGLKKSQPPESLKRKVLAIVKEKYQIDERIYEKYVQEAVIITRDMLTLLPPLIITVHPKVYDERLHDIKRPAWDESGEKDRRRKLTYYRPILVYGNGLHVAVKGTVGNIKHT